MNPTGDADKYPIDLGVFVGRFQPLHNGHLKVIEAGLRQCQRLLIIVGSIDRARSAKNPFTYEERRYVLQTALMHLEKTLPHSLQSRVMIEGLPDFFYPATRWYEATQELVSRYTTPKNSVALIGHHKGVSTDYLSLMPWPLIQVDNYHQFNATQARQAYFSNQLETIAHHLPPASLHFLKTFQGHTEYARLCEETKFIRDYQASWAHSPYPPIFVTTDSMVTCQNHLLLIQRGHWPGKWLWALPGGFVDINEPIETARLRELQEETSIELSRDTLLTLKKAEGVFDAPERSQIGRVITHAAWFDLPEYPAVKAADDAADIQWIPLSKLSEWQSKLHDDHAYIVRYFLNKMG